MVEAAREIDRQIKADEAAERGRGKKERRKIG